MKRPNTCTNLIRAINTVAAGTDAVRLSRQLANVIVGQMRFLKRVRIVRTT